MKRILLAVIALSMALCLTACMERPTAADKTADSLGSVTSSVVYTAGEDSKIEYGKYTYDEATPLDSKFFTRALSTDLGTVKPYIEDFEKKLAAADQSSDVVKNYDYNYSAMEKGDFFYITDRDGKDAESRSFSCYALYIFDRTDNILYFFHVGD